MNDERPVSLFRNGRNQAVRIPREFELEGSRALIRKDGDSLVITPIRRNRLLSTLQGMQALDEDFPDIEDKPPETVDTL